MNSKEIYDYIIKIQAIAKTGLVYSKDPYAISNYQEINEMSRELLEHFCEVKLDRNNYFEKEVYPTPNISVRTVIFNVDRSKVLMVREVATQTYSLPGGWCDLYESASETAKKECLQEAGAEVKIVRLVGLTNRTPFKNSTSVPDYVAIFEGELLKLNPDHEYETDDVNWFDINNLPELSRKTSKAEIERMINAALNKQVIYD